MKLGAITDNYRLGSSIILQRDLFEPSLNLDAYVESIVIQRLRAYNIEIGSRLFDSPEEAWRDLSRAAMGVPRTLGIVLKQAWHRSQRPRIRRTDLDYGVRYASRAYLNQMLGSSRDGVAIPAHIEEIWDALTGRAIHERAKSKASPSSHFVVLPRHEEKLKYLNMFFLIHLLEQGRTAKKEKLSRSLYSFDYGVCLENNLDWTWDKDVVRQQRFAYDGTLAEFDRYYRASADPECKCSECGGIYLESQLQVAGTFLTFCPRDKAELSVLAVRQDNQLHRRGDKDHRRYKVCPRISDELVARQIADDVGCYIQKVAKFGENWIARTLSIGRM